MNMNSFIYRGKTVRRAGFVGLGKSTQGILAFLSKNYPSVEFVLRSSNPPDTDKTRFSRVFFGKSEYSDIEEDVIFLSPSVRRDKKELIEAKNRGVILSSDAELFFESNVKNVFAITGSDGKSTTSYLTSRLLLSHFPRALPCGNFGEPLSPHICDRDTALVTELSSFQLNYMKPKSEAALITNITKNHLNWHSSFEEYISAKAGIFTNAKKKIINFDCPISRELSREINVFATFSAKATSSCVKKTVNAEHFVTLNNGFIEVDGKPYLNTADILAVGYHNILNFMAAISITLEYCSKSDVINLAKSFRGLPHRCEKVGTFEGVTYYNSSIDSSPKRTLATLDAMNQKVILILGGRSKGLDYSELCEGVSKKAVAVIITGENRGEIHHALLACDDLSENTFPIYTTADFTDAISLAKKISKENDVVLLSPASTSFDSFTSFEERGEVFKKTVKKLYSMH